MEEFLKEMADILDEETVKEDDRLDGFESWDSLAVLSVVAMADSRYRATFAAREIRGATTVGDLYRLLSAGARAG
ncbi:MULTISPECIES: acyl carrier protein [Rhodanobacter]|uniref:Acyl carrier protein n=1 Tax=Rhodanobacter hydrolyticus TaxID=2250595 RepID=A0ABW8JAJ6_9GAMM|nr:acyl carrier protein [Rhodanobacter sp. 7MK24]MBD8881902.1 acyl carrier protein [Rhodanobacter sp. 7MK24]